ELHALLQAAPIGFLPELMQSNGFDQSASTLRIMFLAGGQQAEIVGLYFTCFSFPSTHQTAVLRWLQQLAEDISDPTREHLYKYLLDRVLSESSPDEADWLYRCALEKVRTSSGDPVDKVIALHVGRLRYAAARSDRNPTIYDEQAIANDIAMSVR